jgi:hypothetical protein
MRRRWVRRSFVAVIAVALCLVLLNLLPKVADDDVGTVHLINDTNQSVRIGTCDSLDCSTVAAGARVVTPGDTYWQNTERTSRLRFQIVHPDGSSACKMLAVGGGEIPKSIRLTDLEVCS